MKHRFVNIPEVQTWMKVREVMNHNISTVPNMHCKECGDTNPKHGFYPTLSSFVANGVYETSMFTCNRCALSDKEYEELFGEPKELVENPYLV